MADIQVVSPSNCRSKRTVQKRSTSVDLTPMVDLGFLLVTFFVFTSALTEPKVMDMSDRAGEEETPVKQSGTLTLLAGANNAVYYYHGIFDPENTGVMRETNLKEVRSLIMTKKRETNIADLMFIIKADSTASFGSVVKIIDEMSICQITAGHYAETAISGAESKVLLEKIRTGKAGE